MVARIVWRCPKIDIPNTKNFTIFIYNFLHKVFDGDKKVSGASGQNLISKNYIRPQENNHNFVHTI
jgi:hypothetical protein